MLDVSFELATKVEHDNVVRESLLSRPSTTLVAALVLADAET